MGNGETAYRICHVIVGLEIGGAEQALKRLLGSSAAGREDFLVVSLTSEGRLAPELRRMGIRVEALGIAGVWSAFLGFWRLRQLLKSFGPDIVQTWMYHANLFGGLAARSVGLNRVVWGIRNTEVPRRGARQRLLSMAAAVLSHSVPRAIICVASAARTAYVQTGYRAAVMRVVSNGLDFEGFDRRLDGTSAVGRQAQREKQFCIGCVGRWHADKGQDILFAAAREVLATRPEAAFVFVGRGCSMNNPAFSAAVEAAGIAGSIRALDEQDDVIPLLDQMTVFCLPSRTEGFPNALAEAMAMGLPCVATTVGDVPEVVGETALLVPPEDPTALARALLRVEALGPEGRLRMGAAAAARIRERYTLSAMRTRYYELYDEIIEGAL